MSKVSYIPQANTAYKPPMQKAQASDADTKPPIAGFSRNAVKADGMFFSRYQRIENEAPQVVAMRRMELNNEVATLVQNMASTNSRYHEFQHNGQKAILTQPLGTSDLHLSVRNGQSSGSLLNRFLHPVQPIQFKINLNTNAITQTNGQKMSESEMIGTLRAVNMGL